ncbi:hypothetical protein T484DRAFT_1820854 [Baffinella frigidus]|nr:hypothetical protein T484DRAFT_1820854 [Cryptophyta sp. CCMP2293]
MGLFLDSAAAFLAPCPAKSRWSVPLARGRTTFRSPGFLTLRAQDSADGSPASDDRAAQRNTGGGADAKGRAKVLDYRRDLLPVEKAVALTGAPTGLDAASGLGF